MHEGWPWGNLNITTIQAIVDQIYGISKYEVTEDGPWFGLVTQCLQTWWNNIATKASEVIKHFINDHKDDLTTKELIGDQIEAYLQRKPVYLGSKLYTYAYQWAEWNNGINSKGFGEGVLVLSTFANGYLAQLGQFDEGLENEKPVGALILAMQAVGWALEQWKTSELLVNKDKLNHFSADNYNDIKKKDDNSKKTICIHHVTVFVRSLHELSTVHWKMIISSAHEYLLKARMHKSRFHATSMASTLVEEEEDPDADFIMDLA
ncbi:hypothetical protein APHAL10511_000630 [Amanita phalloides]|nr:hypothetical protein APHAL10511_000630 [Amanita phalloides]